MATQDTPTKKKSNWRSFSIQLFLIIVLPLTVLLLAVAFGSQSLHHDAMRDLVGDRDLRTVRAASSSIEREIVHLSSIIQIISRDLEGKSDFSSLILSSDEISALFDGGLAQYSIHGDLIRATLNPVDWQAMPGVIPDFFSKIPHAPQPIFSSLISPASKANKYVLVGIEMKSGDLLVGAFSPDRLIDAVIDTALSAGQTTLLVIGSAENNQNYDLIYLTGPATLDGNTATTPGIQEALNGESGITYYHSDQGERVVAFDSIAPIGWGLVIEEAWEDIASPYLMSTQSAPLIVVPVFLLTLVALWYGARWIVTPLQKLEKQAVDLAAGNFEAIQQPVGGIEEIRNLQSELIDMANRLKAAQHSLRSYIGSITAGIENERRSLARELHDDTIQALIALNQRIQLMWVNISDPEKKALVDLQELLQRSMTNLRRMIRGLRPIYLEDLGLVASLEMLVREIGQNASLLIAFESKGAERRLDPKTELSLYRMIQESVNNVLQHANAEHAWVELNYTDSDLFVQVRDDGRGFDVPTNPAEFPEKGHFGLLGLQERAELIGADLNISSGVGKGTIVLISVSLGQGLRD